MISGSSSAPNTPVRRNCGTSHANQQENEEHGREEVRTRGVTRIQVEGDTRAGQRTNEEEEVRAGGKKKRRPGYFQEYRKKNQEKLNRYNREFYHKTKTRLEKKFPENLNSGTPELAEQLESNYNNSEPESRQKQYAREYRLKNRERMLNYFRAYHTQNRAKISESQQKYMREYRQKNKKKLAHYLREYSSKQRAALGLPPPSRNNFSWKNPEGVRRFTELMVDLYNLRTWPEDWYRISLKQVLQAGGIPIPFVLQPLLSLALPFPPLLILFQFLLPYLSF
jgi:hypothetical protein